MTAPSGTINLIVDLDVQLGKTHVKAEDLNKKIKAALEQKNAVVIDPNIKLDLPKIEAGLTKQREKLAQILAKSTKDLGLGSAISQRLHKELMDANSTLVTDGKILGSSLRTIIKEEQEKLNQPVSLNRKNTVVGSFLALENQNVKEFEALLHSLDIVIKNRKKDFTSAGDTLYKSSEAIRKAAEAAEVAESNLSKATRARLSTRIKLTEDVLNKQRALDALTGTVSPRTEYVTSQLNFLKEKQLLTKQAQKDVDALAKAEKQASTAATVGTDAEIKALRKLVDVQVSQLGINAKVTQADIASNRLRLEGLEKLTAQQSILAKAQEKVTKAESNLAGAANSKLATQIKYTNDLLAAQRELDKLKGRVARQTEVTAADLAALKEKQTLLAANKREAEALKRAERDLSAAASVGVYAEIAALNKLLALQIKQLGVNTSVTQSAIANNKAKLSSLETIYAKQLGLKVVTENVQKAEAALASSASKSLASRLKLTDDLISKQRQLDLLVGGGASPKTENLLKEAEALRERIALIRQSKKEVDHLAEAQRRLVSATSLGAVEESKALKAVLDLQIKQLGMNSQVTQADIAHNQQRLESLNRLITRQQDLNNAQRQGDFAHQSLPGKSGVAEVQALTTAQRNYQKVVDILRASITTLTSAEHAQLQTAQQHLTQIGEQLVAARALVNQNNRLSSSYTSLSLAFRSFIRYGLEMAGFYKAAAGASQLVKSVVSLEDSLKEVQAIARATDEEMNSVAASVNRVAIATEFSTAQIADAAKTLAQAGVDISKVGEALDATAKFASATGSSLATSADLISTMFNVFSEMDFSEFADQLTSTINLSKLTADGLSTILSRAVEVSDSFKIIPQQMNAAFAVLSNAGIKASTISTGYREAVLELFSPDEKTLKFLEKRYAEIGQTMSQEAISNLFSGFQNAADPIAAAANELNKLGFATSAATEFSRVFSVRAKNVLDVLVKQQDQYGKLASQIGVSGSAAKGASTQLEALGKSWDNLGSIVTAVSSSAIGSSLHQIEQLVDKLGDLITAGGEATNTLKRMEGTTGSAVAGLAGLLGSLSAFLGRGASGASALGIAGRGFGIAGIVSVVESSVVAIGEKIHEGAGVAAAKVVEAAGLALTVSPLISRFLTSRATSAAAFVGPVATLSQTLGNTLGQIALRVRAIPAAIAALTVSTALPLVAAAAAGIIGAYYFFGKSIDQQLDAVRHDIEAAKNKLKDVSETLKPNASGAKQYDELAQSLDQLTSAREEFFSRYSNDIKGKEEEVSSIVDRLVGVSTDLEGGQMIQELHKLEKTYGLALGSDIDLSALIDRVNAQGAAISQAEGQRAALYQKLQEAYEASTKTADQQRLIKVFELLDNTQKKYLTSQVTSASQATEFLKTLAVFTGKATDGVYSKFYEAQRKLEQELNKQILDQQVAAVKLEVEKAIKESKYDGIYAKILQAVQDGVPEIINAYGNAIRAALKSGATNDQTAKNLSSFADNQVKVTTENNLAKATGDSAKFEKDLATSTDRFRRALDPAKAEALGLGMSSIGQNAKSLADRFAGVDSKWKDIYKQATSGDKSTSEIVKYLSEQEALHKDFAPVLREELRVQRAKLASEEKAQVEAKDILYKIKARKGELDRNILAEKQVNDDLAKQRKFLAENEVKPITGVTPAKDIALNKQITEAQQKEAKLAQESVQLAAENKAISEELNVHKTNYDHAIGRVARVVEETAKTEEQVKEITKKKFDISKLQLEDAEATFASAKSLRDRADGLKETVNPAEKDAQDTESALKYLADRKTAREENFKRELQIISEEREANLKANMSLKDADQELYAKRLTSMEDLKKFNKETLDELLAAEKRHAEAVHALEAERKANKVAESDFLRGIERQNLDESNRLEFDHNRILEDSAKAKKLLAEGNYSEGKALLDKTIADQQAYVQALQGEGGYTDSAISDTKALYKVRDDAVNGQINLHKQEQEAAKLAADAQIASINTLTEAIKDLSALISGVPRIDKKLSDSANEAASAILGTNQAVDALRNNSNVDIKVSIDNALSSVSAIQRAVSGIVPTDPATVRLAIDTALQEVAILKANILDIQNPNNSPEIALKKSNALSTVADVESALNGLGQSQTPPEIKVMTREANSALSNLYREINSLSQVSTPSVAANTAPASDAINSIQSQLNGLRDKTIHVNVIENKVSSDGFAPTPIKRAAGGAVFGEGTATSDSIPAWLSNGEFVFNAKAVQAIGLNKMEYMNKHGELPKFATGGMVSAGLASDLQSVRLAARDTFSQDQQEKNKLWQEDYQKFLAHVLAGRTQEREKGKKAKFATGGHVSESMVNDVLKKKRKDEVIAKVNAILSNASVYSIETGATSQSANPEQTARRNMIEAARQTRDAQVVAAVTEATGDLKFSKFGMDEGKTGRSLENKKGDAGIEKFNIRKDLILSKLGQDSVRPTAPEVSKKVDTQSTSTTNNDNAPREFKPAVVDSSPKTQANIGIGGLPGLLPTLQAVNSTLGSISGLLMAMPYSNIAQSNQKTHVIEIKSAATGATATIKADAANTQNLLDVLKTLKSSAI